MKVFRGFKIWSLARKQARKNRRSAKDWKQRYFDLQREVRRDRRRLKRELEDVNRLKSEWQERVSHVLQIAAKVKARHTEVETNLLQISTLIGRSLGQIDRVDNASRFFSKEIPRISKELIE